jgi:peptide/nickel transport system substrate-binding protein
VLDPPLQDIERLSRDTRLRIWREPENLIFFLGMDQARAELAYADREGPQPVQGQARAHGDLPGDRHRGDQPRGDARPRGARGGDAAEPGGGRRAAGIEQALRLRPGGAKRLLAEAGYPDGFAVELDCQNVRENIATAVAGMLARIGIRVKVNSLANAKYFAKGQALDTSFYVLGWGGQNTDAAFTLQPLLHSRAANGDGDYNWGNYRDAELDA